MFGDPRWFRWDRGPWPVRPVHWRGWLYCLGWTAVMLLPGTLLMSRGQWLEVLLWFLAVTLAQWWDCRQMYCAHQQRSNLWILDDDEAGEMACRA